MKYDGDDEVGQYKVAQEYEGDEVSVRGEFGCGWRGSGSGEGSGCAEAIGEAIGEGSGEGSGGVEHEP